MVYYILRYFERIFVQYSFFSFIKPVRHVRYYIISIRGGFENSRNKPKPLYHQSWRIILTTCSIVMCQHAVLKSAYKHRYKIHRGVTTRIILGTYIEGLLSSNSFTHFYKSLPPSTYTANQCYNKMMQTDILL